ncbi:diphthine--ammonia ligase [Candidatus Bathyarchaeota archaeon]|nr:diphthine--ammonia ligase [Candidatus Bathyarchaeota archaeon]
MKEKVVVAWSGGKDSALALYTILNSGSYEVLELLTTVTKDNGRISIHDVRRILLEQQARALRIPLEELFIPKGASDAEYESKLLKSLKKHRDNGISSVVFGDLFIEDIKRYREQILEKAGINGVFPLWKKDTRKLAYTFISLGFEAVITSVDSAVLGKDFAGRKYNEKFLSDLPVNVDPCGENGEFHTFVYNGPIFCEKVYFKKGALTLKDNRFYSYDLLAAKLKNEKRKAE